MTGVATLAYGLLAPGAASATSYQAGYPPSNLLLGKVGRPWKSLKLGLVSLDFDLGESKSIALVAINDINIANSISVSADDTYPPTSNRQNITGGTDKQGRTKGSLLLGTGSTVTTGAPTSVMIGGTPYWRFPVADTSGFPHLAVVQCSDGTDGVFGEVNDTGAGYIDLHVSPFDITGTVSSIAVGTAFKIRTARYVRIQFFATATLDGLAYYRAASVFMFENVLTLVRDPLFGESSADLNHPQSRADLDNGVTIADSTGPSFMTPTLQFSGSASDDHEQIVRLARAGLCWLNLNDGNVGDQWPVRHFEPKTTRKFSGFNRETVQIPLKEEV